MRDLKTLFTTLEGRIGRGQFWLGALLVLVAFFAAGAVLIGLGLGVSTTVTGTVQVNGGEQSAFQRQSWSLAPWPAFILSVATAVPLALLGVKRRHDRDGSGIDVIAFWIVALVLQFLAAIGLEGGFTQAAGIMMFVWAVCLFIVLGILRGTVGSNKYGHDPLGGAAEPKTV